MKEPSGTGGRIVFREWNFSDVPRPMGLEVELEDRVGLHPVVVGVLDVEAHVDLVLIVQRDARDLADLESLETQCGIPTDRPSPEANLLVK